MNHVETANLYKKIIWQLPDAGNPHLDLKAYHTNVTRIICSVILKVSALNLRCSCISLLYMVFAGNFGDSAMFASQDAFKIYSSG